MRTFILCALLSIVLAGSAHARLLTADRVNEPQALLPYCTWLPDKDGSLGIGDVSTGSLLERFAPLQAIPLTGSGPVWIRLVLIKTPLPMGGSMALADKARLVVNLGQLPQGRNEIYFSEAPGPVDAAGVWHAEAVLSHEDILLPEPGLLPLSVFIRLEEMPGPWFAPVVQAEHAQRPDLLPSELLLPGLLIAAAIACLLRALAGRAQWAFWSALFLASGVCQAVMPLPALGRGVAFADLPPLLAPGLAVLLLPHVARCMFRTDQESKGHDLLLYFCSLLGAAAALGPLVPDFGWLSRLFPLSPLLLLPLLPLCIGMLSEKRPGSLAFTGATVMPLLGAGLSLYVLLGQPLHPLAGTLAAQGGLWGMAVGGLGLALARMPRQEPAGREEADPSVKAGLILAESAADAAKAEAEGKKLPLGKTQAFVSQSQYDEMPPLPVSITGEAAEGREPEVARSGADTAAVQTESGADNVFADEAPLQFTKIERFQDITAEEAAAAERPDSGAPADALAFPEPGLAERPEVPEAASRQETADAVDTYDEPAAPAIGDTADTTGIADAADNPPGTDIPQDADVPGDEAPHFVRIRRFDEDAVQGAPHKEPDKQPDEQPQGEPGPTDGAKHAELAQSPEAPVATQAAERIAEQPREEATGQAMERAMQQAGPPAAQKEPDPAQSSLPAFAATSDAAALPDIGGKVISLVDDDFSSYTLALMDELADGPARHITLTPEGGYLFNLHSLVREVHDIVGPIAKTRGLIFSWFIAPSLPILLEGDAPRLRGALSLLLQNAVQASRQGAVQLAVRRRPGATGPGDLLFTISDNGSAQRTDAGFFHAWELAAKSGGSFNVDYSPAGGTRISFSVRFSLPSEEAARHHLALAPVSPGLADDLAAELPDAAAGPTPGPEAPALPPHTHGVAFDGPADAPAPRVPDPDPVAPVTFDAPYAPDTLGDEPDAGTGVTVSTARAVWSSDQPDGSSEPPAASAWPSVWPPAGSFSTGDDAGAVLLEEPDRLSDPLSAHISQHHRELLAPPDEADASRYAASQARLPEPRVIAAEMTTSKRKLLAHYLQGLPYELIHTASNGELLELAKEGGPALYLFDGDMPEPDIIKTMAALRALPGGASGGRSAVLALTGHESQSERLRKAGAGYTLVKPFQQDELRAIVATALPLPRDLALTSGDTLPADAGPSSPERTAEPSPEPPARTAPYLPERPASQRFIPRPVADREVDLLKEALKDAPAPAPGVAAEVSLPPVVAASSGITEAPSGAAPQRSPVRVRVGSRRNAATAPDAVPPPPVPSSPVPPVDGPAQARPPETRPVEEPSPAVEEKMPEAGKTSAAPAPDSAPRRPVVAASVARVTARARPAVQAGVRADAGPDNGPAADDVDLLEKALADAPKQVNRPTVTVSLPPRHGVDAPDKADKADDSDKTGKQDKAEQAAPFIMGLSPEDVTPAPVTDADSPVSDVDDAEAGSESGADRKGSLLDFVLPETSAPEAPASATAAPETSASETSGPETSAPESAPPAEAAPFDDSPDSPSFADEALNVMAGARAAAQAEARTGPRTTARPEPAVKPEPAAGPAQASGYPLPGIEGEYLDISVIPLAPGIVHALGDILKDAEEANANGSTMLMQDATARLASKAEHFGLHKLGKIARCVERAAEADDGEAVCTLYEDLAPVTRRYMDAIQECFQSFLSLER